MTYRYTDPDGDRHITASPDNHKGTPVVTLTAEDCCDHVIVRIPADRVEELIAGIRDTARQAAGGQT
jgi:hypothetical protein